MTIEQIKTLVSPSQADLVSKILSIHGQYRNVKYSRPLKLLKKFQGLDAYKHVDGVFRLGIGYENLKATQEKRLSGEIPAEPTGLLKNGDWLVHPYLILSKTGKVLVRLYTLRNARKEVTYEFDGKIIGLKDLEGICASSEFNIEPDLDCFDINLDYIKEITP